MEYFRERAIFYEKHGKYTDIRPNPNPKSEYASFWREEQRRWEFGYARESDGEWIPGWYYFYLNYSPIWLNEIVESNNTKKNKAKRVRKFPKPWEGDYLFFHYMERARSNGHHCKLLKTRGVGFSYKTGAISPCNMYVEKGLPNFHLASDKTFLEGDKGVFGKVVDVLDWIAEETPFPKLRLIDKPLEKQLGYKDEFGVKKGVKSSVFGISLKDNPDKARGVRGPLIHYEEDGLFPNLETAWGVNRKAVEDGDNVYGMMFAGGTGGTKGANFAGSEKLFYHPGAYNIQGIANLFDKNSNGAKECGFFWGAYLNRANCYDEDQGVSDVVQALVEVLKDRHLVKYNAQDPAAITQKKAEEPITPQESIMRVSGTIFPVSDLRDYLEFIYPSLDKIRNTHYVGELGLSSGEVKWKPNTDVQPIYDFPPKNTNNLLSAVEIFEMPKKNSNNEIDGWRYIAGADVYDDDTGTSLGSIFVMDLLTDRLVAEYTGRPKFADDFFEICRRLTMFYNGKLLYENNKKGLFSYFNRKNSLFLLEATPQILRDQELVKTSGYGNKAVGVNATETINVWARRLIRDWLLRDSSTQDDDKDGEASVKLNMHNIRSKPLLDELIAWNPDGNFDRVSSLGMLMICREDRLKLITQQSTSSAPNCSIKADDPYFN